MASLHTRNRGSVMGGYISSFSCPVKSIVKSSVVDMAVSKDVLDMIKSDKVVIFSKSYCPYCKMAKDVSTPKFIIIATYFLSNLPIILLFVLTSYLQTQNRFQVPIRIGMPAYYNHKFTKTTEIHHHLPVK